jgi:hypothetical protein
MISSEDRILAEFETRALVLRHADIVARRRPQDLTDIFTPDARWFIPGFGWGEGIEAIVKMLERALSGYAHLVQTVHGSLIALDGDRAKARSYITEFGCDYERRNVTMTGVYEDTMVRDDGHWRFSERHFTFLYRGRVEPAGKHYSTADIPEWPPT